MISLVMQKIDANQMKKIRFKTSMLQSDLCDYRDAYIVVKWKYYCYRPNDENYNKKLAFKNNAVLASCISKINNTRIDHVKDLHNVTLMYNLIEYNRNY